MVSLGLSQSEAELGATVETFVCPNCACRDSAPTHSVIFIASVQYSTVNPSSSTTAFQPCTDFLWGEIQGEYVSEFMLSAYESIVHWQPNVFLIPFNKAKKLFVREIIRLYQVFTDNSVLRSISLLAISVHCKKIKVKATQKNGLFFK